MLAFLLLLKAPTVADLSKDSFFKFTSREKTIPVVHFYGRNCPACIDAEATYEELSRMYHGENRLTFGQIDCDRYNDLCESMSAGAWPAWLVWLPSEPRAKRYNRNIDVETFERWIRQQMGIWPYARQDNLLYENKTEIEVMRRRSGCLLTIVDNARMPESQGLHAVARGLEKKTRRGVRFAAVDASENAELAKKLLADGQKYGAFVHSKGKWTEYKGGEDERELVKFLGDAKCGMIVATPTPTPEPLPELPDMEGDEFIPEEYDGDAEVDDRGARDERVEDEEETSDWTEDDGI